MELRILLPSSVLLEEMDVQAIVAETSAGSYGLLPHRLDCATSLVPGILTYSTQAKGEVFVAVDMGVMVKTGDKVLVSVRRALVGSDLGQLRKAVESQFLTTDETETTLRKLMAKLETGFLRRFVALHHE
ncbi:MAG: F0F1 ATP synthase subunit epsilon [Planctomycetes bacterium]|nr:F0F1 ATP synthase subunit epsilon [Planctomycetota bacterium]MCB9910838.1 F0F1 ATP synthase subunit epsilon [Planctomycetota bacterium]MCB9912230.1 F0F1 ATP synthase subunit epsilon [Planctomycetota bacterium]HPF13147.1 F0F1 ATP synthase subunit epsilon [Planctomycetota bacterium]HRV80740.1 F0F1 ATP synthase subunit epsilon [Planctomycetota bacterium]